MCVTLLGSNLYATIYEDAEDANTVGWSIYDNNPAGATISNVLDNDLQSNVIVLQGLGRSNGYILGDFTGKANAWNNRLEKNISWKMNFNEAYTLYVSINTTKGSKYLRYSARDTDIGDMGNGYIHHGLGANSNDGTWRTFSRDLEADLLQYDVDNALLSINGFLVRGSGKIDDLALTNNRPILEPINYEDAENGDTVGWSVYDNTPEGATITNAFDAVSNSHVIELSGSTRSNGYQFGNWAGQVGAWGETERKTVTWNMNYSEPYSFYFIVNTTLGDRYMYYSSAHSSRGILNGGYIHLGLGEAYMEGKWHTITKDLEKDLKRYEPANSITSINGLLIRGSGKLDDIIFTDGAPLLADTVYEDAEVGLSPYWKTVVGATPPTHNTPGFESLGFVKLTTHWKRLDNGDWVNKAEYHLPLYNASQKVLFVDIGGDGNNMPHYVLGVKTRTLKGLRTLLWDSWYTHQNMSPKTVDFPDGSKRMIFPSPVEQVRGFSYADVNLWENFSINVENQLQLLEPDNEILSIETFIATGGNLDNLKLKSQ